jgi:hypothetical protein
LRYLFASIDPNFIDLEWIAPVVSGYQILGHETDVICLHAPSSKYEKFWVSLVTDEASNIIIGTQYFDTSPQFFQYIEKFFSRVIHRLKATFSNQIRPVISTNKFKNETETRRSRRRIKRLADWISGATVIFIPYIKQSPPLSPNADSSILIAAAKKATVPIVSYPAAVSTLHNEISHIKKFDAALLTVNTQISAFPTSFQKKVGAIGAPKFRESWRKKIQQKYENDFASLPNTLNGRELILVILKNDTSILWSGLDFFKTTRDLIDQLRNSKRILVLKPHPRQSQKGLNELLEGIPKDQYFVDYGPISYWASKAQISVSLFSGGAIDALAEGKIPYIYWPVNSEYRHLLENGNVPDQYVKLDANNKIVTQFDNFACVITSIEFNMPNVSPDKYLQTFKETFCLNQSPEDFKNIVDQLLNQTTRDIAVQ